eukprot:m.339784 g.339784  ORF g.339784 m.339784 type:complete len:171 (+) comp18962_c0_seq1:343-855(+)
MSQDNSGGDEVEEPVSLHKLAAEGKTEELLAALPLAGKKNSNIPPLNERDEKGQSVMDVAATYGHADIIKILLEKGKLAVDEQNAAGVTALHRAAMWNQEECCKVLLEAKASTDLRTVKDGNRGEETPEQCAQRYGHTHIVTLIQDTIAERKRIEEENAKDPKGKKKKKK